MVAMTRAQIADPEFANKAREGREDEIYHCIRGNQGCIGRVFKGLPINCTVNPGAGREQKFGMGTLTAAESPESWLVVGGGPGGLKAAETLAKRGHTVTVFEKEAELGGQVNLILKTPGRDTFEWITKDLRRQLARLEVDVRLDTEATADAVRAFGADNVILATGAVPSRTGFSIINPLVDELPGVELDNVVHGWDVLEGAETGERVVVLDDDGNRASAGFAEVLLDQGKQVKVVTRHNALFPMTLYGLDLPHVYNRVMTKGIEYELNCWASAYEGSTLAVFNLYTGQESTIEGVDSLVLGIGPKANDALYFELKNTIENLHRVGDCVAPRKLDHAIYEGYVAGRELWDADERYIYEGQLEEDWDSVRV